MTRQAVAKHLAILEEARLVSWKRRGREKLHFINPVPINEIAERWIGKFERPRLACAVDTQTETRRRTTMTNPTASSFVYVTYIRTTPERLWTALTSPEFMKQYWFGMRCEVRMEAGSSWRLVFPDGRVADTGEIVEADPPKRLVIRWRNEFKPELKAEGYSRCTIDIEPTGRGGEIDRHARDGTRPARNSSRRFRAVGRASCPTSSRCSRPAKSALKQ